jgi:addiction module RelE/StbE family toxin
MAGYRVGFTPRALADVQRVAKWWRTNRPSAPRLFQNELDLALLRIAAHPEIGASIQLRVYPDARTYLLRKSGYVVLYNVDDAAGVVAIARVRHTHRRPLAKKREH